MRPLPIDQAIPEVIAALCRSRSLVLVAPPGAGKTTRVPPAVLAAGMLPAQHPNLVMLQPRRVAARASAQRIAEEQGWTLGQRVGFHVRFERRIGRDTRLRVLTEGILTRQLMDDPTLDGIGAVILDEFHERSIHTDVCVALLREVQQSVRDDLILIVMSATLDAEPIARFLGDCPIVRSEGRTFPVAVEYAGWSQDSLPDRAADAVRDVLVPANAGSDVGDVLVFLPGVDEIRRTGRQLESLARERDLLVLPLHGSLPPEERTLALQPARQRKVILATNVAETSLTIDGVRTVIDCGFARIASYDPQRGLDRLDLERISKASAAQRAGRAGRTAPGRCIRLWSATEEQAMTDFQEPEIRRVDLCSTILMLHAWGISDPRSFGWFEPPLEETVASAERLLAMLGALDAETNGRITPQGHRLVAYPAHPRIARLLMAAEEAGRFETGAAVTALLSEKDIAWTERTGPFSERTAKTIGLSDLSIRLQMLDRAEKANFAQYLRDEGIDPVAARQAAKARDDLLRINSRRSRVTSENDDETVMRLALLAYPDRVCRRRESDPSAAAMVGGWGVRLAPESVVRKPEFFLALDARQDPRSARKEAIVRIASGVELDWLESLFPNEIRRERKAVFDESRGRVVGRGQMWYRDLLLREDDHAAVDPAEAARALGEAVRPLAPAWFAEDEAAANFLARVALLRQSMPEQPWPSFDAATLGEALAAACAGKRSLDDLRRVPPVTLLSASLQYPLDRLLDQHAPESITVPSGSSIPLDYRTGPAPILAVRLQEIFGWTDTPRVAGGRIPVLLHLLGPNFRPVQITNDLRSFWTTTYFQVRKDLRIRYPKHSWPEDPLSAKPEAKGKPRRPA